MDDREPRDQNAPRDERADELGLRRRLSFARYLLNSAERQIHQPEPECYAALLQLHDAAELFAAAACAHHEAGRGDMGLMDLINSAQQKSGHEIKYRMAVGRMNAARVSLKHRGIWPNKVDLTEFFAVTQAFIQENCQQLIGFPFSEATMIAYVEPPEARDALHQAHNHIETHNLEEAAKQIAVAFFHIQQYLGLRHVFGGSHFPDHDIARVDDSDAKRILEKHDVAISNMRTVIGSILLGIDRSEYAEFQRSIPHAHVSPSGEADFHISGNVEFTEASVRKALDFLVRLVVVQLKVDEHSALRAAGMLYGH
jgi:hypothetical protein